ncbi:hypothetical protein [Aliagarivorans marinus]|uniref:hypothetical protein n=1 Tax=Aliagarivorans marinus TaxID=561965 RepID=UPI0004160F54|nr:hypothetical protein [Aliagarivorans marinus]
MKWYIPLFSALSGDYVVTGVDPGNAPLQSQLKQLEPMLRRHWRLHMQYLRHDLFHLARLEGLQEQIDERVIALHAHHGASPLHLFAHEWQALKHCDSLPEASLRHRRLIRASLQMQTS